MLNSRKIRVERKSKKEIPTVFWMKTRLLTMIKNPSTKSMILKTHQFNQMI